VRTRSYFLRSLSIALLVTLMVSMTGCREKVIFIPGALHFEPGQTSAHQCQNLGNFIQFQQAERNLNYWLYRANRIQNWEELTKVQAGLASVKQELEAFLDPKLTEANAIGMYHWDLPEWVKPDEVNLRYVTIGGLEIDPHQPRTQIAIQIQSRKITWKRNVSNLETCLLSQTIALLIELSDPEQKKPSTWLRLGIEGS